MCWTTCHITWIYTNLDLCVTTFLQNHFPWPVGSQTVCYCTHMRSYLATKIRYLMHWNPSKQMPNTMLQNLFKVRFYREKAVATFSLWWNKQWPSSMERLLLSTISLNYNVFMQINAAILTLLTFQTRANSSSRAQMRLRERERERYAINYFLPWGQEGAELSSYTITIHVVNACMQEGT